MGQRERRGATPRPNSVNERMLQEAIAQVSGEMPDVADKLRTMKPYQQGSWIDRMMFPKGAYAVTMPFSGRMMYDPETLTDRQTLLDTLSHEGEHVRQMQGMSTGQKMVDILGGMFTPYEERWQEKEARRREEMAHQNRIRGDIKLPPSIDALR